MKRWQRQHVVIVSTAVLLFHICHLERILALAARHPTGDGVVCVSEMNGLR